MPDTMKDVFKRLAWRIQRFGIRLSLLAGSLVGVLFGLDVAWSWRAAFLGFLLLLFVGIGVVIASVLGERVAPGDWRAGLNLSCLVFLTQTTLYALATLALRGVLLIADPAHFAISLEMLALRMLPALYLCSVTIILLSGPMYLRWRPVPRDWRDR